MKTLEQLATERARERASDGPMVAASVSDHEPRDLCVGIATYEDFDGAYFTLHSLRVHHREVLDRVEFLLVDNHPFGSTAKALREVAESIPACRYVPYPDRSSTAVRDHIFQQTRARSVLVLDSHVLLASGALAALLDALERPENARNLIQGPLLAEGDGESLTHMDPGWRAGMFGTWAVDARGQDPEGEPFEIPMHGLGLFACRRDAWPGLHPGFRGFGGEEGYVHELFRQAGGRTLCLPKLGWHHRFRRPKGVPYPLQWADRFNNYLLGWSQVGWDTDELVQHFRELINDADVDRWLDQAETAASSPLAALDAAYFLYPPTAVAARARVSRVFDREALGHRLTQVPSEDPHASPAAALCDVLHRAAAQAAERTLIFTHAGVAEEIADSAGAVDLVTAARPVCALRSPRGVQPASDAACCGLVVHRSAIPALLNRLAVALEGDGEGQGGEDQGEEVASRRTAGGPEAASSVEDWLDALSVAGEALGGVGLEAGIEREILRIADTDVEIQAPPELLGGAVDALSCLSRSGEGLAESHVRLRLRPAESSDGATSWIWQIDGGERQQGAAESAEQALDQALSALHWVVACQAGRRLFVHGALVSLGGKTLLMPGRSHSGKSTLVEALLRAGADYGSDEYALLDEHGQAWPYPRRLRLRGGDGGWRALSPSQVREGCRSMPMEAHTVDAVLFAEYSEGRTRGEPSPVGPSSAAMRLLENTVRARSELRQASAIMAKVVRSACCWRLERGEAEQTAHMLSERLGDLAGG